MSDTEKDPYIGEIFEDCDRRMAGRRVKVLSRVDKKAHDGSIVPAYRVETVLAPFAPWTVGNSTTVTPNNLDKRYRKVSH